MLSKENIDYLSKRAKVLGAVKSADSVYQEIDYNNSVELTFSTHYFNKDNKEVMYAIHDLINVKPDSEVYLGQRTWGKISFNALVNWQDL